MSAALRDAHLPSARKEDRYYLLPNFHDSCSRPKGGVKGSEVKGDGRGGVVYNMWVYVTAAAVITAL